VQRVIRLCRQTYGINLKSCAEEETLLKRRYGVVAARRLSKSRLNGWKDLRSGREVPGLAPVP
jgi:hypothetical protein